MTRALQSSEIRPGQTARGAVVRTRRSLEDYRIEVSGQLVEAQEPALVLALEKALVLGAPRVVLDLRQVDQIDRACVHAILLAHLRASDELQQLVILPGRPGMRAALEAISGPFLYADA